MPIARGPTVTNSKASAWAGIIRPRPMMIAAARRVRYIEGQLRNSFLSLLDDIALVKARRSSCNVSEGAGDSIHNFATRFGRPACGQCGRLGQTACRYG